MRSLSPLPRTTMQRFAAAQHGPRQRDEFGDAHAASHRAARPAHACARPAPGRPAKRSGSTASRGGPVEQPVDLVLAHHLGQRPLLAGALDRPGRIVAAPALRIEEAVELAQRRQPARAAGLGKAAGGERGRHRRGAVGVGGHQRAARPRHETAGVLEIAAIGGDGVVGRAALDRHHLQEGLDVDAVAAGSPAAASAPGVGARLMAGGGRPCRRARRTARDHGGFPARRLDEVDERGHDAVDDGGKDRRASSGGGRGSASRGLANSLVGRRFGIDPLLARTGAGRKRRRAKRLTRARCDFKIPRLSAYGKDGCRRTAAEGRNEKRDSAGDTGTIQDRLGRAFRRPRGPDGRRQDHGRTPARRAARPALPRHRPRDRAGLAHVDPGAFRGLWRAGVPRAGGPRRSRRLAAKARRWWPPAAAPTCTRKPGARSPRAAVTVWLKADLDTLMDRVRAQGQPAAAEARTIRGTMMQRLIDSAIPSMPKPTSPSSTRNVKREDVVAPKSSRRWIATSTTETDR